MLERPLIILGCGFIGTRLARAALATGRPVRVTTRKPAKLAALAELGAEVMQMEVSKQRALSQPLMGTREATVVYSVPPQHDLPAGTAVQRAAQESIERGVRRFIYFGSAGIYGSRPNLDWVDEDSGIALDDSVMAPYIREEGELAAAQAGGLHTVTLRLAAVYGGGRGVRGRLRKGDYQLVDGGEHYISRIHIDDLVRIIMTAEERAPSGATYLVGDDRPALQKEYAEWLSSKLGLPMPASVPAYGAGQARKPQRGRRLKNDKLKSELNLTLRYPTFVEGEAQIDAEESGTDTSAPTAILDAVTVPVSVPSPPPVPVPVPVPVPTPISAAASSPLTLTLILSTKTATLSLTPPLSPADESRILTTIRDLITRATAT